MRRTIRLMAKATTICVLLFLSVPANASDTKLTITPDGRYFAINGVPTFLNGVSYYGALAGDDFEARLETDLTAFRREGFNWVRVWTHWGDYPEATDLGQLNWNWDNCEWELDPGAGVHLQNISVTDWVGEPREPYMSRLVELIERCDDLGIIVDVTFQRGNHEEVFPQGHPNHKACVEAVRNRLLSSHFTNIYFDADNESHTEIPYNYQHPPPHWIPIADLTDIVSTIKFYNPDPLDPDYEWLVTCSHIHNPIDYTDGWEDDDPTRLNERVEAYLTQCGVDFLSPHYPRGIYPGGDPHNPQSPSPGILQEVRDLRDLVAGFNLGQEVPIHLQEPFRQVKEPPYPPDPEEYCPYTRYPFRPEPVDFIRHCMNAKVGGTAGWCFHTLAGCNLSVTGVTFEDRLDRLLDEQVEQPVFEYLGDHLGPLYPYHRRYQAEYDEQINQEPPEDDDSTGPYPDPFGDSPPPWGWEVVRLYRRPASRYMAKSGPEEDLLIPGVTYKAFFSMATNDDPPFSVNNFVRLSVLDGETKLDPPGDVYYASDALQPEEAYHALEVAFTPPVGHSINFEAEWPNKQAINNWGRIDYIQVAQQVTAEIVGPNVLGEGEQGTWTATHPNGAPSEICEYFWLMQPQGGSGWSAMGNEQDLVMVMPDYSITLKVEVTDRYFSPNQAVDYHDVGLGAPSGQRGVAMTELPVEYALHQNHPNPFEFSTEIRFQLPQASRVSASVYDMNGREVASLLGNEMRDAGYHHVAWEPEGLPSGTYTCRLVAGDFVQSQKMVLIKSD